MNEKIEFILLRLNLNLELLKSDNRKRELCEARQIISVIIRTDYKLVAIGEALNRDHSSIVNSISKHESSMIYEDYRNKYKRIQSQYNLFFENQETFSYEDELKSTNVLLRQMIVELKKINNTLLIR